MPTIPVVNNVSQARHALASYTDCIICPLHVAIDLNMGDIHVWHIVGDSWLVDLWSSASELFHDDESLDAYMGSAVKLA